MVKGAESMEALVVFLEGENAGSEIRLESPREYLIGRSEQCDIFIGEKKVSRKHAKIVMTKEGIFLEDLESTNGTFVEGRKITSSELQDGDTIRIGMTVFKVNIIEGQAIASDDELLSGARPHPSAVGGTIENDPVDLQLDESSPLPKENDIIPDESSGIVSSVQEIPDSDGVDLPLDEIGEDKKDSSEDSVSQSRKKPLSGDLSEMALPDILQMLKNNRRTGTLEVSYADKSGSIYIENGEVVGARLGIVTGFKAIFRMLSFNEGTFELLSLSDSSPSEKDEERIQMNLENLLLEGMRQIDETEKIKKALPSIDVELEINKGFKAPLSKLHPKVLDILQLVINLEKFSLVMDSSVLSDLETSKIVFYLIKKGYIKEK